MVSWLKSSSSTLTDFWFSDLVLAVFDGTDSIASTEGIMLDSEEFVILEVEVMSNDKMSEVGGRVG